MYSIFLIIFLRFLWVFSLKVPKDLWIIAVSRSVNTFYELRSLHQGEKHYWIVPPENGLYINSIKKRYLGREKGGSRKIQKYPDNLNRDMGYNVPKRLSLNRIYIKRIFQGSSSLHSSLWRNERQGSWNVGISNGSRRNDNS